MRRWRPTRRRLNRVWRSLCHPFGTLKNISATPTSVPRHFFVNYQTSKKWPSSQKATSKIVFRNGTCKKWLCMTADKATFTGCYYPSKISLKLTICLSGIYTKTWACVSQCLWVWFWKTLRKDNETTSPRIYVNRRTPSCIHCLNFPDSTHKTEARRFVFQ